MSSDSKITLILWNKTAYIWTAKDWALMRKNRFVGNFVGNLAALPRQDSRDGLPLALLPQEATLMLEYQLAELKYIPGLTDVPSDDVREESLLFRDQILSEQVGLLKDLRKKEIQQNIKRIVQGKKRKRKYEESLSEEDLEKQILIEECSKIQDPKRSSLSVQIFMSDPWVKPEDFKECDWAYPQTNEERLHYLTFKDLWQQGYYVTSGKKFGADYLVYPVATHNTSVLVVSTRPSFSSNMVFIAPRELVIFLPLPVKEVLTDNKKVCFLYLTPMITHKSFSLRGTLTEVNNIDTEHVHEGFVPDPQPAPWHHRK